jgi:hypothetical protein
MNAQPSLPFLRVPPNVFVGSGAADHGQEEGGRQVPFNATSCRCSMIYRPQLLVCLTARYAHD